MCLVKFCAEECTIVHDAIVELEGEHKSIAPCEIDAQYFATNEMYVSKTCTFNYGHREVAIFKSALFETISSQVAFGKITSHELAFKKLPVSQRFSRIVYVFEFFEFVKYYVISHLSVCFFTNLIISH